MAQCAPFSRYLYLLSVPVLSKYTVSERTQIAPAPKPATIKTTLDVIANAPITPSKLKLASNTSRYIKLANAAQPVLALMEVVEPSSWKNEPNNSSPTCNKIPRTDEIRISDWCCASTVK